MKLAIDVRLPLYANRDSKPTLLNQNEFPGIWLNPNYIFKTKKDSQLASYS